MRSLHLFDGPAGIVRFRLHQDGGGALFIRLGVLHALQAGVMLHEAGGEDAGGDRHGAHAQEGDDHPHDPPQERHRVDVPVAHREHGGNAPPDAGQRVLEHLRLGRVLRAVHA